MDKKILELAGRKNEEIVADSRAIHSEVVEEDEESF